MAWGRGRIYAALEDFPKASRLAEICERVQKAAREVDSTMPTMTPTHLL